MVTIASSFLIARKFMARNKEDRRKANGFGLNAREPAESEVRSALFTVRSRHRAHSS